MSGLAKVMKECWHEDSNVRLPALRYFCDIMNYICGSCVLCTLIKQCIYRIKKSLLKIAADDPKLGMSLDD